MSGGKYPVQEIQLRDACAALVWDAAALCEPRRVVALCAGGWHVFELARLGSSLLGYPGAAQLTKRAYFVYEPAVARLMDRVQQRGAAGTV